MDCACFAYNLVDQVDIFLKIDFSSWVNPADEIFVEAVAGPLEDSLQFDVAIGWQARDVRTRATTTTEGHMFVPLTIT